jgi:Protein of unknown function (DUF1565).
MLIASLASAASITVSSDLQAAINAAQPGDTLLVAPGTYEKISIGKSLNLIGNGAVIQAGERDACVNIEASDVSISGFLVRNGFYGIKLNNVRGCTVANNTVIRCTQPGIALLFPTAISSRETTPASTDWGVRGGMEYTSPTPMTI